MGGTTEGGQLAAATNKQKYGNDFYSVIGRLGGSLGHNGGFAAGELGRLRAQMYGKLGGSISRRGPGKPMTPERKAQIKRKLQRDKVYKHLLRVQAAHLRKCR